MAKYFFGILLVLVGAYFFAENLGYEIGLDYLFSTYWPVLIIIWGLKELFSGFLKLRAGLKKNHFRAGQLFWGILITGIGVVLYGNNLGMWEMSWDDLWNLAWPLFIIYLGINILLANRWRSHREIFVEFDSSKKKISLNKKRLFIGDSKFGNHGAWNLEDLNIWHGIGSTYINLATAIIPEREVIIDISGWIGEVTVLVPQGLPIKVNIDIRVGDVTLFNNTESGVSRFISYITEDYNSAVKRVNLMISHSIGEVKVKQVD